MRLWLLNLADRFDHMSLRERALVLAAVLGLMALLWDQLLMRPLERRTTRRTPEIAALRAEVGRLDQAVAKLAASAGAGPDRTLSEELGRLQARNQALDAKLGGLTQGLVAPHQMVGVLRQMLETAPPLKLVSLETQPSTPLIASLPGAVLPAQIYRHGVVLVLEGGFLDLVTFLHAAQALPGRLFWQELDLDVTQHPVLRVRITANTLGQDEAWIGV